ncbi:MAG: DUF1512 domain-containing protein [DPANN group archaeon]|nr:DUF1512 domain-containing protein [DPANN group archaeon]
MKNLSIFLLILLVFTSGCLTIPEHMLSNNKDVSSCSSLTAYEEKSCVTVVAINSNDASICAELGADMVQDCYYEVGSALKNPQICVSIQDSDGKISCQIGTTKAKSNNSMLSFLFFIVFFMFYPKIYIWQMTYQLETELKKLEEYAKKSEAIVLKKMNKKPTKEVKDKLKGFMDFFVSTPVDTDPYGIIDKVDVIINNSERRINKFVNEIAPNAAKEDKANFNMGLKGAMSTVQLFKIVRHMIILTKKMHNLQFAMILQMQIPMIMKMAKANVKATKAFVDGVPIGDSIGPLVAASFKTKNGEELAEDIIVSKETIVKKTVFVMKSKGPGSRLGNYSSAVEKLVKKEKIKYIITVDASQKLEGEITGSVASGVGIAMSPFGVHKFKIEAVLTKYNMEVDGLIIKQGISEASIPMNEKIYKALEPTRIEVEKLIEESKHKKILLIGVGNTVGVDNNKKAILNLPKLLKGDWDKYAEEKKKHKGKDLDD